MKPSLTDILCTTCGLCCDGTLLADVELASDDEASGLEILGLEVEEGGEGSPPLLLLPCRALKGTRCGIYPHRPDCCRRFECRLLQAARRGTIDTDRALAKIADARRRMAEVERLLAEVGRSDPRLPLKERCAEALASTENRRRSDLGGKRDALEAAMNDLDVFVRETFLDG
jgi:Fe-S-cluster containining protein